VHKILLLQTREAIQPPAQKSIVFKVGGQHPPVTDFTAGAHPWVPPLNRNSKSRLFPHLQQHGFENPVYGVYFRMSYPTRKRLSRICWFEGVKVRLNQESKTLFAKMLTISGSLKIQFLFSS
jgi:hypothetical protein